MVTLHTQIFDDLNPVLTGVEQILTLPSSQSLLELLTQIISCGPPGGQSKFYVHRVVLGIQSKFFKRHYNDDVVEVTDVAPEVMAALLDLAYGAREDIQWH